MLPSVSKEVIEGVLKGVGDSEKVRASWEEMIENNTLLFTFITEAAVKASLSERVKGEMFLRGAMSVWETLRVQDEVDEMNRDWGL